jgi:hypothetical protein
MTKLEETQVAMFGMTGADLKEMVESTITFKHSGPVMLAMGMLSDAQEELAFGHPDDARKTLNRAKFVLMEYCMDKE